MGTVDSSIARTKVDKAITVIRALMLSVLLSADLHMWDWVKINYSMWVHGDEGSDWNGPHMCCLWFYEKIVSMECNSCPLKSLYLILLTLDNRHKQSHWHGRWWLWFLFLLPLPCRGTLLCGPDHHLRQGLHERGHLPVSGACRFLLQHAITGRVAVHQQHPGVRLRTLPLPDHLPK